MKAEDYASGLRVIMQALENRGFETWRSGNGPEYDGFLFSIHPSEEYECDCGQEDKRWTWEMDAKHLDECFLRVLEQRVEAAGRELFDDIDLDQLEAKKLCQERGIDYEGFVSHCSCDLAKRREEADVECRETCVVLEPNFTHKPTGLSVEWYKYVGRGMKVDNPVDAAQWDRIIVDCLNEAVSADPAMS